ncbi:elongator complex protein 4 [Ceratobasidium sp. AG-Ba]|nr:elongator complex protein 4 [Ceratobasidium sp. AG-Ba]
MSSFKRRIPSKTPISKVPADDLGSQSAEPTAHSTTDPSLLSGLTALDDLLGLNGLPRGHTLLIRTPDPHSAWGPMLSRYFLAQGVVSGDAVVVVADEEDADDLISGCMWTSDAIEESSIDPDDADPEIEPEGGVKIAWRYVKMKQFSTTVPKRVSNQAGSYESAAFDLTMRIPPGVITHSRQIGQLTTIPLSQSSPSGISTYKTALESVQKLIHESRTDSTSARRAVRIVIPELGSPSWGDLQPSDVIRFLLALRSLIRGTSAAAFITFCSTLSSDSWGGRGWAGKVSHLSDACITFAGFGDDPTAPLAFPSHHGLVKISSSPSPGTLRAPSIARSVLRGMNSSGPHGGGENNLAFRCTRKRLVIETMHLGAEGGVGARQTAPPPDTTIQLDSHAHSHPHKPPAASESARVSIALDNVPEAQSHEGQDEVKNTTMKKKPRRVVFQSDKPEIYDF